MVIVLGFDGLDPSMTTQMGSLKSKRFRVYRQDSLMPLTYPSWSSIMSGVNPGKHGLLDFFVYSKASGRWRARVATALDLEYPRVFEALLLSPLRGKKRFAVVNPVPSYPVSSIRVGEGFVVSFDFFAPRILFSNKRLLDRYYDVSRYEEVRDGLYKTDNCSELLKHYLELLELHRGALKELGEDFDLVWVNIGLPDNFLHRCEEALINRSKHHYLARILEELNSLVKAAERISENIIVVSDHGFSVYSGVALINSILYRHGLAAMAKRFEDTLLPLEGELGRKERVIKVSSKAVLAARRLARGPLKRLVKYTYAVLKRAARLAGRELVLSNSAGVDIMRSKAFTPVWTDKDTPRYRVLLNDESVASEVVRVLRSYGLQAYKASELFWGPYTPSDMIVVYGGVRHPSAGTIFDPLVVEREVAQHARYGVLAIKSSELALPETSVLPGYITGSLVLCLLGAPLDKYMDSLNVVEAMCGRKVEYTNYKTRWSLARRIRGSVLRGDAYRARAS